MFAGKRASLLSLLLQSKGGTVESLKIILLSPLGQLLGGVFRTLITSLLLCVGIQLFDFKNLYPFFKWKRVVGLFLLIFGTEALIRILSGQLYNFLQIMC